MKLRSLVGLGLLAGSMGATSVGCSGHTLLGEDGGAGKASNDQEAGAAGTSVEVAGSSSVGGTAGGPPSALDLTPPTNTCPATCEDAAGTVQTFVSIDQFYSHLVGRWLLCSGGDNTFLAPDDIVGVEYEAPTLVESPNEGRLWLGNMYYLVEGENGPERGTGFDYQLKYAVTPQDGGEIARLDMRPAPTSHIPAMFKYSPCPRQWLITGEAAKDRGALLVPID